MNPGDGLFSNMCFRPRKGQATRLSRDKDSKSRLCWKLGFPDIAGMFAIPQGLWPLSKRKVLFFKKKSIFLSDIGCGRIIN